jgi:hypothetical protein
MVQLSYQEFITVYQLQVSHMINIVDFPFRNPPRNKTYRFSISCGFPIGLRPIHTVYPTTIPFVISRFTESMKSHHEFDAHNPDTISRYYSCHVTVAKYYKYEYHRDSCIKSYS